jgi:hypothetical protein
VATPGALSSLLCMATRARAVDFGFEDIRYRGWRRPVFRQDRVRWSAPVIPDFPRNGAVARALTVSDLRLTRSSGHSILGHEGCPEKCLCRTEGDDTPLSSGPRRSSFTTRSRGEKSIRTIASELGISNETLRSWIHQADIDEGRREGRLSTEEREELRRLRRENKILKQEREILKKPQPSSPRRTGRGRDLPVHPCGEGQPRGCNHVSGAVGVHQQVLQEARASPHGAAGWMRSSPRRSRASTMRAGGPTVPPVSTSS